MVKGDQWVGYDVYLFFKIKFSRKYIAMIQVTLMEI